MDVICLNRYVLQQSYTCTFMYRSTSLYVYILIRVYIYIYMAHASDITLHWRKTTWGAFMSEDLQSKDLEEIRQAPEGKHVPVVCYFLADGGI